MCIPFFIVTPWPIAIWKIMLCYNGWVIVKPTLQNKKFKQDFPFFLNPQKLLMYTKFHHLKGQHLCVE